MQYMLITITIHVLLISIYILLPVLKYIYRIEYKCAVFACASQVSSMPLT